MAYHFKQKRNRNIFTSLLNRHIYGPNVTQDIRIIRTMIESGRTFKKVFKTYSKSPIVCIPDRLFLESFSTCYDLTNVSREPRIVYRSPRHSLSLTTPYKTEEMLMFESNLDQTTFCKVQGTFYANGPYFVAVTADNYLKVIDKHNGKSLEQVCLSTKCKFKYLYWETALERLVVQSTLLPQRSSAHVMHRVPRQPNDVFLYLAIFNVTPLEFVCMLPISSRIFGTDVCNASVKNGLLIVIYRRKNLQFFSFENIIKNHTIPLKVGDVIKPGHGLCLPEMDEFTSGIVGTSPFGVPVNVNLLEKPTVLFEVVSSNHDISFGGYPWHYIANKNQVFHVKSVTDHSLAKNGRLGDDSLSISPGKAFFHEDLSGRILFIGASYLRCLKLRSEVTTHELREQFTLDYRQSPKWLESVQTTKSGRKVKRPCTQGHLETEIIQDFDYDDELDLLVVLYLSKVAEGEGVVGFYDNQTGCCLRSLNIDDVSEDGEHSIAINRNILVIISKLANNFRCLAYVLHT